MARTDKTLEALGDIQRMLGNIEGKLDGHMEAFARHVEADADMSHSIRNLELAAAKQRGFVRALGLIGSIVGAGGGYFVERLLTKK